MLHNRDNSLIVIVLTALFAGFTTTVIASKAMGNSMKLIPFFAHRFNSFAEIGLDAFAKGILPSQNWRRPADEPVSCSEN